MSIKDLKKAAASIADQYHITADQATKILAHYKDDTKTLDAIQSGDYTSIPAALSALGLSSTAGSCKADQANKGLRKASATKRSSKGSKDIVAGSCKDQQTPADDQQIDQAQSRISGDIIAADYSPEGLPEGIAEMVYSAIESICRRDGVTDLKKERQTYWKYICIETGSAVFKKSKFLHDIPAEKRNGGIVYDFSKLSIVCDIWAALCLRYSKAPMIDDFARFAGVSDTFIYGNGSSYDREKATPARVALLKKLHDLQEKGLASMIVDGRQNPTGALAALNHWHGWTTTKEIIHRDGGAAPAVAALPSFDTSMGALTDSGSGDEG